jgi:membrane-bound lytic murein transglycosylase B
LSKGLKPDIKAVQLRALQVQLPAQIADDELLKLLSFEQEKGNDLWVGLENFYVITLTNIYSNIFRTTILYYRCRRLSLLGRRTGT